MVLFGGGVLGGSRRPGAAAGIGAKGCVFGDKTAFEG